MQGSPVGWESSKAAATPTFGEPHTPPGEVALAPEALQLLMGWHPPGLWLGTSEASKAAVNPALRLRLRDRNIPRQDTDLPLSLPAGPNSRLVTSVLALCWDQTGINVILHPLLRFLGRCLRVFPLRCSIALPRGTARHPWVGGMVGWRFVLTQPRQRRQHPEGLVVTGTRVPLAPARPSAWGGCRGT